MSELQFRKLTAEEIEVKVSQVKANGTALLLYKTARVDMDLLDEVVGPERWSNDYKDIKGNLYCGICIDNVWKWDCGIESRADSAGNEKKGEASDAFKRAGFRWGIGRELYTAPFIWIPADKLSKDASGKAAGHDRFSIEKITYDDLGRISGLAIKNQEGKRVYVYQRAT